MFHFEDGLKLTQAGLAIDFRRRQPRGFISHAHADHIAPHELALCTPETARLYQHRLGARRVLEMPYRRPIDWGGLRLTTYPAGHCLGSAMLLAEDSRHSLLYTGDYKLGPSATCERAETPQADVLIMECTYGRPSMRMPPREESIAHLIRLARQAIADDKTPTVYAYALGKAQEVTRILTDAGVPVLQSSDAFEISLIYQACGVPLGDFQMLTDRVPSGAALVVPPRTSHPALTKKIDSGQAVTIAATGWALDPKTRFRWNVDHALPLSDHADYDDLFETVRRVQPKQVYCTHGPDISGFVNRLREIGVEAFPLGQLAQLRLF